MLSYKWNTYAVEYASTGPAPLLHGVDAFQTRVTTTGWQLHMYPSGAVVQVLATGDTAPPMLMHTSAIGDAGAMAMSERIDATSARVTWTFQAYVQQSNSGRALPVRADTLLMDSAMKASNANDTSDRATLGFGGASASDYSSSCDLWSSASSTSPAAVATNAAGSTSGFSCANATMVSGLQMCSPMAQGSMPADLLSGLTVAALGSALY